MNALDSFVKRNHMEQVKFRVGIDKVSSDGMTRYMHFYIGEHDVTGMIANVCKYKLSQARNSYGSLIVHGCGMDMAFSVITNIKYKSEFPEVYSEYYDYLGKKKRGKYSL